MADQQYYNNLFFHQIFLIGPLVRSRDLLTWRSILSFPLSTLLIGCPGTVQWPEGRERGQRRSQGSLLIYVWIIVENPLQVEQSQLQLSYGV